MRSKCHSAWRFMDYTFLYSIILCVAKKHRIIEALWASILRNFLWYQTAFLFIFFSLSASTGNWNHSPFNSSVPLSCNSNAFWFGGFIFVCGLFLHFVKIVCLWQSLTKLFRVHLKSQLFSLSLPHSWECRFLHSACLSSYETRLNSLGIGPQNILYDEQYCKFWLFSNIY